MGRWRVRHPSPNRYLHHIQQSTGGEMTEEAATHIAEYHGAAGVLGVTVILALVIILALERYWR